MFTDLLANEFLIPVYLAAILLSVAAGVVGTLVVTHRLTFLAGGVAHAAYGGLGLAAFFSLPMLPTAAAFSIAIALLMGWITRNQRARADAVIGALWAAGMALGIVLLDKVPGYQADMMSYLFGSLMLVTSADLWSMLLIDMVALIFVAISYKQLVLLSFEEEYARSLGVAADFLYYLLLILIGVTVVVAMRMVGLILLLALLTVPPYLAEIQAKSLKIMMLLASLWAMVFSVVGISLAVILDSQVGPTVILVATSLFLLSPLYRRLMTSLS